MSLVIIIIKTKVQSCLNCSIEVYKVSIVLDDLGNCWEPRKTKQNKLWPILEKFYKQTRQEREVALASDNKSLYK